MAWGKKHETEDTGYIGYCLGNPIEGDGPVTVSNPNDPDFQEGLRAGIEYAAQKRACSYSTEELDAMNQRNLEQWHRR